MDRDTATAKANYCGPGIYGIYAQRPYHNTGNYVPYSLQTVSGFFNVPQSYLQVIESNFSLCLAGVLILNSGDVLEINTTAPSIVNTSCAACTFNASLQNRSSSHGDHLVASITFSGDIKFRSGSTVKVFGKYALSLTSQNGNILIETDINMTCGEEVLNTTCLGGFTQSSAPQLVGHRGRVKLFKGQKIFSFIIICLVLHSVGSPKTDCHR